MILIFILGCIFVGIVLAVILAPLVMMGNKKKLKTMDEMISKFESSHFSSSEEKESAKNQLKKDLIKIKAGIVGDKNALAQAGDKIMIL